LPALSGLKSESNCFMKLSVIIVSWNVKNDLLNCLRSIEENRPNYNFEIIVVDNTSTDGTVDLLRKDFSNVQLLANTENRGFSAANNQAIEIAKGEYVLLLNPDTIVQPHSLDNLVRILDENPTVGACGPRLTDTDGTTCPSVGYVPTFRALLYGKTFFRSVGIFRGHYKKLTAHRFNYDSQTDVEQLSGAALLVRRSVMREIGLMDDNFFMYYEDVDLCLRIRKAGWRIVYVPEAVIVHVGGRSSGQVSHRKNIMLYKSLFIYFRKHRGQPATALFRLLFKLAVIIRHILNMILATAVFVISILLFDRRKRLKTQAKIKDSMNFLARHSWEFMFKT